MAITKRSDKGSALTYTEMDDNFDAIAPRTSNTGAIEIPTGATSDRPGSASDGMFRYNTSLNSFEGYSGGVWGSVGSGGGGGGGQVNQNAWSEFIVAGQSAVSADSATDSVTLVGGTNITITTDAAADEITFAATFNQDFAYSSLTGAPTIPSDLTDLGISDGSINQVLSTDGSGNFTFVNQTGGGTQGAQGTTGIQGPLGTTLQGVQGFTGATGADGNDGADGDPGVQGPAGSIQGIQGTTGQTGQTGFGVQGAQGPAGSIQGIQGTTGDAGDFGPQGFQGFQGMNGTAQGVQGVQGGVGFDGQPGQPGPQGPAGNAQGAQGIQGNDGPAGFGNQGIQGVQGDIGPGGTGPQGAQGLQGLDAAGQQGVQGTDGEGIQGFQGFQGPAGSVQGVQGVPGIGDQGNQGIQGVQGTSGPTGDTGDTGLQGVQGSGVQGIQGTVGPLGIQGNTGIQGNDGVSGLQGELGADGNQGVQGTDGSDGVIGGEGPQGIQGTSTQGIQGTIGTAIQGFQGSVGIQGPADGLQGMQGLDGSGGQGTQGTTGIQGPADGPQGIQGTDGFQGVQGPLGNPGVATQGTQGVDGTGIQGLQGPIGSSSFASSITVAGNVNVEGTASDGGRVILNSSQSGSPSSSSTNWSYIDVERGILPNVSIRWHEGFDRWEFTNDGTNYYEIPANASTLDDVLTSGAESDTPITLFRGTDGNTSEGTLIFESRDTTPNQNASMGDIRFYMDTDVNTGTSTLGEYARISALKDSEWSSNVAGQIQFQVTQSGSLTSALRIGDAPAGGTPTATTFATNFENLPVWMENSLRVYETVDDTNDITSDANISGLKLTAIDGLGNYRDRVSLSHQNNILRFRVTDRVNADEYTELIAQPSATSMLSVNYKASGGSTSSYDVWTDYDGGQKVRTELTDENTLHKFGSYANTEYITQSTDFGGFNGGSGGGADLVPASAAIGSLAFFNWTDALNGTAGANRYIPAGHAEEVVHGMGILRDGGQHSLGAPRWDPFGGPDFRVSVDNSGGSSTGLGGLVYMFGGTSISNDDTPVTTIITNQNYNAADATIISQTSYRTGQNTTTFDHEEYARVTVTAVDVTSGTEDAKIVHAVQKAGTLTDTLTVDPDGVTLTDLTVSGKASFNGMTTEKTNALTGATGTVAHDLSTGAIFDHTSLAADFTVNFTNVPTTNSRTISVALILSQGATAYMPTAVQIDGSAQTILWQGGSAPSGTASGTDIVSFTLIRSSGGAWKVIGSATSYS